MKKLIILLLLQLAFVKLLQSQQLVGNSFENAIRETEMRLYWFDDFTFLDTDKWHVWHEFDHWGGSGSVNLAQNVTILPTGYLRLTIKDEDYTPSYYNPNDPNWWGCHDSSYIYTSGYVESKSPYDKANFGFIEASISFPPGPGQHNAFWVSSPSGWILNKSSEIDIVEVYGDDYPNDHIETNMFFCYKKTDPTCWHTGTHFLVGHTVNQYSGIFRTYGMHYTPDVISWYYDNSLIRQLQNPGSVDYMKVLLTTGIKDNFSFTTNLPDTSMLVDWLKVYTYCSDAGKIPYIINPCDDPNNPNYKQVTINWQLPCNRFGYYKCKIYFGKIQAQPNSQSISMEINDDETYHFYSAQLNALDPGTKYYYKVLVYDNIQANSIDSFIGSFVTPPANNSSNTVFYVTGSTENMPANPGNSSHDQLCQTIMNNISNEPNGQTLLIHTGDMVMADNEDYWSKQWFNPANTNANNLRANIPMISALGGKIRNMYDTPNNILYTDFPGANYRKYFNYSYFYPNAIPNSANNFYDYQYPYTFDHGPVHFCLPEIISHQTNGSNGVVFASAGTASSAKPWKLLCFNYPMKTLFSEPLNAASYTQIRQDAINNGVQLIIMGHENYYAHWIDNGIHYMILGNGASGDSKVDAQLLAASDVLCVATVPHFAKFRVEGDMMFVDVIQGADMNGYSAGRIIESFAIPKKQNIVANTVWQTPANYPVMTGTINVMAQAELKIKSEVQFPANQALKIWPNGKLTLDASSSLLTNHQRNPELLNLVTRDANGTITSSYQQNYSEALPLWTGVVVKSDPTSNQEFYTTGLSNQGLVELSNGARIEQAQNGVTVYVDMMGGVRKGGGIIRAENATFRNCVTAIKMYPFHNQGSNNKPSYEKSYFYNCTFVTDDDYLYKGITAPTHMDLNGIYQLKVQGCSFLNDVTPPAPGYLYSSLNGTGIMTNDASVVITPLCTTQTVPCSGQVRNSFTNLYNGIHITQPLTTQGYSTLIKETDFTDNYRAVYANSPQLLQVKQCSLVNNYRGVYLLNSQGAMVEENHVEIAEENETTALGYPYGLYLDAGHGFSVEGNDFTNTYTGNTAYGILVNNTGAKNNEIYRNAFTGLKVGIQPQFRNKGIVNTLNVGLCLFCNEFDNPDTWDIWAGGKANATHKKNIGINVSQQIRTWNSTTNQWDPYPAGNLFSPGHLLLPQNPNADNDFSNFDADYLSYAYDPSSSNGRMEPLVYSNITLYPLPIGATQCMPKTGNINNLTQCYGSLAFTQVALNSSRLILDIWKNGGIEDLKEQVELVLPWEVYQQYNELMSISPYVAADALIAMVQNPTFTDLMVKLVCVANPQASRNDEVLGALYNRIPPMPEQYMEEILDESGSYSPLDELESDVAADYHLVRTVGDEILRLYYADTTNLWVTDSIGEFLSRLPGLEDRYIYALHCLRTGDSIALQSLLDEIPTQFELSDREYVEYEFMSFAFNLLDSIRENDLQPSDLTPEQTETLLQMLETEGTVDKALAISVLLWNDPSFEYIETILEPAGSQLRKARPQKSVINETIELMLYPIPARDHFTVFYKVPDNLRNSLSIQVKDVSGRIVLKQPLSDNAFEYLFETVALTRGIYTVMLLNSTGLLKSETLVIIK